MKKLLIIATALTAFIPFGCQSQDVPDNANAQATALKASDTKSIYEFKVEALDGSKIDFASFKGKKILIVNTASQCGYTPQYEELQRLYVKFQDKLVIVGFPANNFGGQEPGKNSEIKEFCKKNYGVTFPMAAKVSVKGDDMAPIYKWLCSKSENGVMDAEIKWNFGKFLLDEKGVLINYFPSKVTPMSEDIISKL